MKPKVTIGICAKNSEATIEPALKSAVNQNFPHELIEIIFVDDGSEDNTLSIVKAFASETDVYMKIISGPWQGLGKSRNTIINEARGEFIVWLDSDEVLDADFLRKQVDLLERNPNVGIVTAQLQFDSQENLFLILDLLPNIVERSCQNCVAEVRLPGTGGATYRTKAARQVGGFNETIKGTGEDIELANRIREAGWAIARGDALFTENHGRLASLRSLWKKYVKDGFHGGYLYKKTKLFTPYRMNPLAGFFAGVLYVPRAYIITRFRLAFLLPFHYAFKMTAWFYGFSRAISDKKQ